MVFRSGWLGAVSVNLTWAAEAKVGPEFELEKWGKKENKNKSKKADLTGVNLRFSKQICHLIVIGF